MMTRTTPRMVVRPQASIYRKALGRCVYFISSTYFRCAVVQGNLAYKKATSPWDHLRALGVGLPQGPRVGTVSLERCNHEHLRPAASRLLTLAAPNLCCGYEFNGAGTRSHFDNDTPLLTHTISSS